MGCTLSSTTAARSRSAVGGRAHATRGVSLEPSEPAREPNSGTIVQEEKPYVLPAHDHDHGVPWKLNCKRDTPDHRDWIFNVAEHSKVKGESLPTAVDLRSAEAFPIYSQGELGSCTANALAAAFHYSQCQEGMKGFCPSRLFIYYNERAMEGHIKEDAGASLRDGISALNSKGVCEEQLWPYDVSTFTQEPPKECYAAALDNRVRSYARVEQNLDDLKGCLAAGHPFVFGFVVTCDFMAGDVRNTGVMEWPPRGMPHGGHAVQACGYDDEKECFFVRNSWGEEWGDKGHFYMPYAFITHPQLCHDFWSIVFVEGAEFPIKKQHNESNGGDDKEPNAGAWCC